MIFIMDNEVIKFMIEGSRDTNLEKRLNFLIELVLDDYLCAIDNGNNNKHRVMLRDIISKQRGYFTNKLQKSVINCLEEWYNDGKPDESTNLINLCRINIEEYKGESYYMSYTYKDFHNNTSYGEVEIVNNDESNVIENSKILRELMGRVGFIEYIK